MRKLLTHLSLCLIAGPAFASVHLYVEESQGKAWVKYNCTGGEIVRAFALDVTVNQGQITGVSDFFRGESTAAARGYGIFPASFRDHITVTSGTNVNWNISTYTPIAVVADRPNDTQPGLNSQGVTLEFGALWDPDVAAAVPPSSGTLCALQISEPAQVTISANQARGGVASAFPENIITPVFTEGYVDPSVIISDISVSDGVVTITFKGGELESAVGLGGEWTGTGNTTGTYSEPLDAVGSKFFRVRRP